MLVVAPRRIVLRVDGERSNAGKVGGLHRAQNGILQKAASYALLLPVDVDRQASQQQYRDWMPREPLLQPFRRVGVFHLPDGEAVVPDYNAIDHPDVSLRCIGGLQCMFDPPAIQIRLAAIEGVNWMVGGVFSRWTRIAADR